MDSYKPEVSYATFHVKAIQIKHTHKKKRNRKYIYIDGNRIPQAYTNLYQILTRVAFNNRILGNHV